MPPGMSIQTCPVAIAAGRGADLTVRVWLWQVDRTAETV